MSSVPRIHRGGEVVGWWCGDEVTQWWSRSCVVPYRDVVVAESGVALGSGKACAARRRSSRPSPHFSSSPSRLRSQERWGCRGMAAGWMGRALGRGSGFYSPSLAMAMVNDGWKEMGYVDDDTKGLARVLGTGVVESTLAPPNSKTQMVKAVGC